MASGNVIELNDDNFHEKMIQSELPVLVDFWATWCSPCLAIAPHIEALAEQFKGQLIVSKVDVDKSPHTATDYNIRSIPTLMIFKKGRMVSQLIGGHSKPRLEQFIRDGLQKSE